MPALTLEQILPGSIAEEAGLESGDRLVAINGQRLRDIIDYSYYISGEEELLLEVLKANGEEWEIDVRREPGCPLGLIFTAPEPARCRNNCLFCFVHQLPKGLRKALYVKDEDYRLSFLNGTYVTLANLKQSELKRIIEQRLSPLYVSVHATNPVLRERLLGKQGIPPILEQLATLAAARINLHTQVVLCPELNDGPELERTVTDLAALYPAVQSLAIVPVGLTAHRGHLPRLSPVDGTYARRFIETWSPRATALAKRLGAPFLFLADEFYLMSQLPFPPLGEYGDLPQLENGVGMVPLFRRDANRTLGRARQMGPFRVTVVTGMSAYPFINDFICMLGRKTGVDIQVVPVVNRLFGESVTVCGLLAGNDIVAALAGRDVGAALILPEVMFKEGEGILLDDMSRDELERRLGCPVMVCESTPGGCYRAISALWRNLRRRSSKTSLTE